MLFVNDLTWKPEFPPVLSDEQWNHITDRSELPLEARYNIDNMIGLYRQQLIDAEAKHPDIFDKLDTAKQAATEALARLDAVISDSNTFAAITMGIDGQRELPPNKVAAFRCWLEQQHKQLQSLVTGYENAIDRVHNRKRGPKTGHDSLLTLVGLLNELHKAYTGRPLSRSGNKTNTSLEFVWNICRLANPTLKRSTVEEAVKEVIFLDRDYDSPGVGSEKLIPVEGEQGEYKLHIETNCSFMPIFHALPSSGRVIMRIHMSMSEEPCRDGIHWRILPWQD